MDLNLLDDDDLFLHDMVRLAVQLAEPAVHLVEPNLEENRVRTVRNKNYFEMTIPRYSDIQFREHFRMSRQTFQLLLDIIGVEYQVVSRTISLEKKLLFTIWMLSKPESFLAAGDRFNIPKSFSHTIFYEIVFLINNLVNEYIRWPNNHNQTINAFRARSRGIPGIVGAIDGCHIPIKQPEGNPHDYFNRKQFHSIILQAHDININVEDIDDGNLVREQERGPAEQKRQHLANICTRHVD